MNDMAELLQFYKYCYAKVTIYSHDNCKYLGSNVE